jgi:hypothetical protein
MITQREASVIVSSSVPISVYDSIRDVVKNTGQKRSRVICELLKMGLKAYSLEMQAEKKKIQG